jgi:hypothetical protein
MNNPYLTKIQEIKKEITRLKEEVYDETGSRECLDDDYKNDENWEEWYNGDLIPLNIRLKTAVEFLQMTKQFVINFRERNFDTIKQLCPREFEEDKMYEKGMKDVCKEQNKIIDKELENINSALKEAGDKI